MNFESSLTPLQLITSKNSKMKVFEEVSTALSVIKPSEVRVAGWGQVLPPIFNWEEDNLKILKNLEPKVSELIASTEISKLKEIDDKMKEFAKLARTAETERKELTQPIVGMTKRLMVIEKTYEALAESLKPTYMTLKKLEQAEVAKAQARSNELTRFRSEMQTYLNNREYFWRKYNQDKVTEVFKDALDFVEFADLQGYVDEICAKHTAKEYVFINPNSRPQIPDQDFEKTKIWEEVAGTWSGKKLADEFDKLIETTFSNFQFAKNQKEEAIKQREAEQIIETQMAEEDVTMENALVILDEKASPVQTIVTEATRDIKKVWSIEMEHTVESMSKIDKAWYQNRNECLAVWQGKDPWTINTIDKANQLSKLRNKDERFQPDGIVFVQIEKI
jgi:hypothetical protein